MSEAWQSWRVNRKRKGAGVREGVVGLSGNWTEWSERLRERAGGCVYRIEVGFSDKFRTIEK